MKKGSIGQTKHMTVAKATRQVLQEYQIGQKFTLQDDLTKTGVVYDVAKILGYFPKKEAVKKAMERLVKAGIVDIECLVTVKSIYQKK